MILNYVESLNLGLIDREAEVTMFRITIFTDKQTSYKVVISNKYPKVGL
jgi:hypothetical protein